MINQNDNGERFKDQPQLSLQEQSSCDSQNYLIYEERMSEGRSNQGPSYCK